MCCLEIGEWFAPKERESANVDGFGMMESQNRPKSWHLCNKLGMEPRFTDTCVSCSTKLSELTCCLKSYRSPRTISITLKLKVPLLTAGRSTSSPFVIFWKQAPFIKISFVPFVLQVHPLNSLGTQIKAFNFRGIWWLLLLFCVCFLNHFRCIWQQEKRNFLRVGKLNLNFQSHVEDVAIKHILSVPQQWWVQLSYL